MLTCLYLHCRFQFSLVDGASNRHVMYGALISCFFPNLCGVVNFDCFINFDFVLCCRFRPSWPLPQFLL